MSKKNLILLIFIAVLRYSSSTAQIIYADAGTDITIKSGTSFSLDGLTLTPSADYSLSSVSLNRNSTVTNSTANQYVARVYKFSNTCNSYSGSARINYQDGELNGLPEASLQVNIHNGISWQHITSNTNDALNNYVLSNAVSGVTLNEFALASLTGPLPVNWLYFTAQKQNNAALIQWSTAREQNSKEFVVYHSHDGLNWEMIAVVPAKGSSNSESKYSFLHSFPATGTNFYQVLLVDIDNRHTYTDIRKIQFEGRARFFSLLENPVANRQLRIRVNTAAVAPGQPSVFYIYSSDGKLLWSQKISSPVIAVDMSRYTGGMYLLTCGGQAERFVLK